MMNRTGRKSVLGFGNRLVLWFVAFALFPLIVTGICGHVLLTATTGDQMEKLMLSLVDNMKHDVEHYFDDIARGVKGLAGRRMTLALLDGAAENSRVRQGEKKRADGSFMDMRKEFEKNVLVQHLGFDTYRDVFLIDSDGVVVYSKNRGIEPGANLLKGGRDESSLAMALQAAMHSDRKSVV
jgi:hypothetical protein